MADFLKNSIERHLKYIFSAVEINDLSQKLAARIQEKSHVEAEKKTVMSQYGSRVNAISADANELADKVSNGFEMRKLDCKVEWHKPKQGEKTITRPDTNERMVEKMTTEEWNLFNQEEAQGTIDKALEGGDDDEPKI